MKELRAIADYVIIDSPPCAITTDPLLISEYSDGILFVIRQDSTHRWTILDCINNISTRGCNIIGGVLNAAKESILDPGYSYGYYGYGDYRGYDYGRYDPNTVIAATADTVTANTITMKQPKKNNYQALSQGA